FKDKTGAELPYGGGAINELYSIDTSGLDPRLKDVQIDVACDVTNPLTGENGASAIFGPQKGATPEMVELLDKNLVHYATIIHKELGMDVSSISGAGAAGGLGAALIAFLHARLLKGIDLVIEFTGLEQTIQGADYVFTGEGSIDHQTLFGKT